MKGERKKPQIRFSRAVLPPEKFHTTKKGARGYRRTAAKRDTRRLREQPKDDGARD